MSNLAKPRLQLFTRGSQRGTGLLLWRKRVDVKLLSQELRSSRLDGFGGASRVFRRTIYPLSAPGTSIPAIRNASAGGPTADSEKPGSHQNRGHPDHARGAAGGRDCAARDGKSLAEWLRDLALKAARQRPADPLELLLAEQSATRYMLLNLFHATAQANGEGKHLLPNPCSKFATRPMPASSKWHGNCWPIFLPRKPKTRVGTEVNCEPSDAISAPIREDISVSFRHHFGTVPARSPRLGLADLDAHAAPKVLSFNVLRKLRRGESAPQPDAHPVGNEDDSGAQTRSQGSILGTV